MSKALRVVLDDGYSTRARDVSQLTLAQLIATEPTADAMLRAMRDEIGRKIKALRVERDLSLEQVRDMTKREIDSAGLSRLERGLAWSHELAQKAIDFLEAYPKPKKEKAKAGR
jgi:hypothetical protein